MPLIIDDEILREAHLSEAEARVEIAAGLYQSGHLSLGAALKLANVDHAGFKAALKTRSVENGQSRGSADDEYESGYRRIPEDWADVAALLPHLPLPQEQW